MSQAQNLTIKKADGTTDVTYSVITASAGDSSPAIWADLASSPVPNARPILKISSGANAAKTARWVDIRFEYPYVVTNPDGTTTIVNRELFTGRRILPQDIPDDVSRETAVQLTGLLRKDQIIQVLTDGYAPV